MKKQAALTHVLQTEYSQRHGTLKGLTLTAVNTQIQQLTKDQNKSYTTTGLRKALKRKWQHQYELVGDRIESAQGHVLPNGRYAWKCKECNEHHVSIRCENRVCSKCCRAIASTRPCKRHLAVRPPEKKRRIHPPAPLVEGLEEEKPQVTRSTALDLILDTNSELPKMTVADILQQVAQRTGGQTYSLSALRKRLKPRHFAIVKGSLVPVLVGD